MISLRATLEKQLRCLLLEGHQCLSKNGLSGFFKIFQLDSEALCWLKLSSKEISL